MSCVLCLPKGGGGGECLPLTSFDVSAASPHRPPQWEKTMLYSGPFFGSALDFHNMYLDMWGEEPTYQSADGAAGALVLMHAMVLVRR